MGQKRYTAEQIIGKLRQAELNRAPDIRSGARPYQQSQLTASDSSS
jgi:hypothetical protein